MNRLKWNFLALIALSSLVIVSCEQSESKVGQRKAAEILSSSAFKGLTDSIRQFPAEADLYLQRASRLSQLNLHKIAEADYQKAWDLTSDAGIALEYISNLLLSDKLPEAIRLLQKCIRQFPETTEFSRRLGEVYLQTGEPDKALAEYNNILKKDSSNFEAWFDKGSLLAKLKDTAGAIAALEQSFVLLPINYSGLALANLYIARKDPRALEICNILIAKDSTGAQIEPIFMKGVYYSEINQLKEAVQQFDECIKRDWKMTDAYIEKGIILYENKQLEQALNVFNLAATVSNTDPDAYYWIGRCYESTGDKEKAAINYQRAFALDGSFTEARDALRRLNG